MREKSAANSANEHSFGQTLFEFKVFSFTQKSGPILHDFKSAQIIVNSLTFTW